MWFSTLGADGGFFILSWSQKYGLVDKGTCRYSTTVPAEKFYHMLFAIRLLPTSGGCALQWCNSKGMRVDLLQVIIEAVRTKVRNAAILAFIQQWFFHLFKNVFT